MSISNSVLAQSIADLVEQWKLREEEMQTWLVGDADGGPSNDGRYPLTDYLGTTRLTKSPARLEADVSGLVTSAATYASAAAGSVTGASDARTAAEAARDLALSYRNTALTYKDSADLARSAAETAAANALGQASNASASAAAALVSEGNAATSAADADADAIAAAASAAAAAASAAAAATFNPADYRALANPVPWADLSGVPSTFTPSAHTHAAVDITSGELSPSRVRGVQSKDTRAVDSLPYAFPLQALFDFKQRSTLGFTGTGSYGGVVTFAPWGDASGGPAFQLALSDNSGGPALSIRQSVDAATWGAWKTVSFSDHTHSYLPLTGGTLTGAITFNDASLNNFIRGAQNTGDFAILFGDTYDVVNPIIRGFGKDHASLAGRLWYTVPAANSHEFYVGASKILDIGSTAVASDKPLITSSGADSATLLYYGLDGNRTSFYVRNSKIGGELIFDSNTVFRWRGHPSGAALMHLGATGDLTVNGANSFFNADANSTTSVYLGSSAAVSQETRLRLRNSLRPVGVDFIIDGSGNVGFYDRDNSAWKMRWAVSDGNIDVLSTIDTNVALGSGHTLALGATTLAAGSSNSLRVSNANGYVDVGPQNSSYSHFITDRAKFYFGTAMEVNGSIYDYNAGTARPYLHLTNTGMTSGGNVTLSTSAPSGGADGDIWLKYV